MWKKCVWNFYVAQSRVSRWMKFGGARWSVGELLFV